MGGGSLIIESLGIKNWRGYREPHNFEFSDGINILCGRNEAGKSTVFEVITRVLFDRHNSKAEEIKSIQPLGSTLSPKGWIVFTQEGSKYKVKKRFLNKPRSKLYGFIDEGWVLEHEGDIADQKLREILHGEEFKRVVRELYCYSSDDQVIVKCDDFDEVCDICKRSFDAFVRQMEKE